MSYHKFVKHKYFSMYICQVQKFIFFSIVLHSSKYRTVRKYSIEFKIAYMQSFQLIKAILII
jgi:hypothetical protein